jgi:hypothetical protein
MERRMICEEKAKSNFLGNSVLATPRSGCGKGRIAIFSRPLVNTSFQRPGFRHSAQRQVSVSDRPICRSQREVDGLGSAAWQPRTTFRCGGVWVPSFSDAFSFGSPSTRGLFITVVPRSRPLGGLSYCSRLAAERCLFGRASSRMCPDEGKAVGFVAPLERR